MNPDNQENLPFAERTQAVEPFLAMEILERAQELEKAGKTICHLEVGEPAFETPAVIVEGAIAALREGETHYTHSQGIVELREAISRRYRERYAIDVDPAQVLVTAGSSSAFFLIFGALVEKGDEVIVATPHYACYPSFIRFFAGKMVTVPTDPADGYVLDPAEVKKRITPRTRALLINSPANPTGAVLDSERLKALAELGIPIVSDEIYHGLVYEGEEHPILEFTPNAFVVDGFSKRYAMTGFRLGYVVAAPKAVRTLQKLQQNFQISVNSFVQRAGVIALQEAEGEVERMRQVYDRRRKLLVEISRDVGFEVPVPPRGAFYVFADISRYAEDSFRFAFDILEKTGVGVTPGVDFGEAGRKSIRLSFTADEDTIIEAGRRLKRWLK